MLQQQQQQQQQLIADASMSQPNKKMKQMMKQ
jgi:hypothetical protein